VTISRIRDAIDLAAELHGDAHRKGSDVPYLFHLLAVAAIVAEHGGTEDEVVAALLHDAVEDAGGAAVRDIIARRFGGDVGAIVDACTDTDVVPKPPWRPRKEAFVASLANTPPSVRLVVAADKLHNVRCTARDLRARGADVWSLFRGGKDGTLWYYDAVRDALARGWSHPILGDLRRSIAELHELADPSR
jgi:(p)ppGpp synthase/HD superfamily hydrolase